LLRPSQAQPWQRPLIRRRLRLPPNQWQ
jgi:hypothetical protein